MTYREWPNLGLRQAGISQEQPKAIFWERAIPACRKPELIGSFKLTFRGLKNAGKSF
jgi:hypothetical protein